ncbi:DNA polymerase III subunit gamma/tau [Novacetimonas maltaceti]|uniref:DNA polymerase III subunit gamma/tau n=1 Tax=Novacetimonas maltaceti TaxID=1203393 RepID=A0A2S3W053_9PROT|nr:DNA polymerase III subunit gamma/tau [Novacetimonas maltaceti]POF62227.1 DNA polymerase III subunit tau [Novacetimonas maltaceti]PYD59383.1 DNA polymerase III subunit gamma/tau [Novacetimonas maltaceti]
MNASSDQDRSGEEALPSPPVDDGPGLFGDAPPSAVPAPTQNAAPYRVLARKYRPTTFDDLIGQDTTVRILRNAFALGRVAHAFMLTGVRGVGKTTTARIIARALNCTGPDGQGGPTADPCGVCPNCVAILADRHPDVMEMDAASRTGVDDVREIIDSTRFRPIQGRMKVFIIDEVHMLSRNAFNALLKTLEEPPSQVTFIFATTELRKVPVTVLSRCQTFDLRRVPQDMLAAHFDRIAAQEGVRFAPDALALIARAADGSVRDGLSLLDQAIAQGTLDGEGQGEGAPIDATLVSGMLGQADRGMVFDLLDAVLAGRPDQALVITDEVFARGADLGVMLADVLDLIHSVSRLKAVPHLRDSSDMPQMERERCLAIAERVSVPVLGRTWQMLLKGQGEVEHAPDRRQAAEMVLIRMCYVADLPPPGDLVRQVVEGGGSGGTAQSAGKAPASHDGAGAQGAAPQAGTVQGMAPQGGGAPSGGPALRMVANGGVRVDALAGDAAVVPPPVASEPVAVPEPPRLRTWREVVAFVSGRDAMLHGHLRHSTHLVAFAAPEIRIRVEAAALPGLARRLETLLRNETGDASWTVRTSEEEGEPTLAEQGAEIIQLHRADAASHPLVQAVMAVFPSARLGQVTDHALDDYGLPPEENTPAMLAPDLEFAPLDAELVDEDDLPTDD